MSDVLQGDINILKMNGDRIPLLNLFCGNQQLFICEKEVRNTDCVTVSLILSEKVIVTSGKSPVAEDFLYILIFDE